MRRTCEAREADAVESNRQLDELIANLGYGVLDAVQEYVSNSISLEFGSLPKHFPVSHDFEFDPVSAELKLRVSCAWSGHDPHGQIVQVREVDGGNRYNGVVAEGLP